MRSILLAGLALCAVTTSAFALSRSADVGGNHVTATMSDRGHLENIAWSELRSSSARGIQLHAWFVDSEGAILVPVSLNVPSRSGAVSTASSSRSAIPARAASVVVLAQPAGLRRTALAAAPAQVAQIALP